MIQEQEYKDALVKWHKTRPGSREGDAAFELVKATYVKFKEAERERDDK